MNIKNLNKQLANYFQHHVVVDIKMTPVPTTSDEVQHLYRNFKSIGNLEFFRINRDKSRIALYDSQLLLAYNPSSQGSLLKPEGSVFSGSETKQQLKQSQDTIINTLNRVIALPRYAYVANDDKYWNGDIEVLFKYHLNKEALMYDKKFKFTPSVSSNQLIMAEDGPYTKEIPDFRKKIRHNFQKFHKFDSIVFKVGVEGINQLVGYDKFLPITNFNGLSYSSMLNLDNTLNSSGYNNGKEHIKLHNGNLSKGFNGFYD